MFPRKMFTRRNAVVLFVAMTCLLPIVSSAHDDDRDRDRDKATPVSRSGRVPSTWSIKMSPSRLKRKLEQCSAGPFYKTDFSIGHGAAARCNSRSTPRKAMKRARAWARAFKNVT